MRGVILAGGTGSRLGVLTKTINKHCLPVYDRPMIFWPLGTLLENSIEDITIVSTPDGVGQLARLLGSGKEHGCRFTYKVQDQPGGIAQALSVAIESEYHGGFDTLAVILGDNVFLPSIRFDSLDRIEQGAKCFLSHQVDGVEYLKQFGVPSFHGSRLEVIEEKPEVPKSEYAVTGLYVFGTKLKYVLKNLPASKRGEVEITDVLNVYAMSRDLRWAEVSGFWGDAGTVDGMAECASACRKEIAK